MPLERVQGTPEENAKKTPDKAKSTESKTDQEIARDREKSLGDARELVDKLERSEASARVKALVLQECRTAMVRQGQPALDAFEKAKGQLNTLNLTSLTEAWMEAYLNGHPETREGYTLGRVNPYELVQMLYTMAVDKALTFARAKLPAKPTPRRTEEENAKAAEKDVANPEAKLEPSATKPAETPEIRQLLMVRELLMQDKMTRIEPVSFQRGVIS
jgi:hypothetical protein